ncbi:MAG TPA: response regulator [Patescibacteria group bacterium]|nr:response regulator [Patescibacteria group bacterium]
MNAQKGTVLVVDDQPGIRQLLAEVLQEEGYQILTAANGRDGVRIALENDPAVILMDMKMPGMNGLEALHEVALQGQGSRVILMTAYGELDMFDKARAGGASACITKPFDIGELCRMVDAVAARHCG